MSKGWKVLMGLMIVTAATAAVAQAGGIVVVRGDMRKRQGEMGTATMQCTVDDKDDPRGLHERAVPGPGGGYLPPRFVWKLDPEVLARPGIQATPAPATLKFKDINQVGDVETIGLFTYRSVASLEAQSEVTTPALEDVVYKLPVSVTVYWEQSLDRGTELDRTYGPINMPLVIKTTGVDDEYVKVTLKDGTYKFQLGFGQPKTKCVEVPNLNANGTDTNNIANICPFNGDDELVRIRPYYIHTGPNGVCQTESKNRVLDKQIIEPGCGEPGYKCITEGDNTYLDTVTLCGDDLNRESVKDGIHVGSNGICDTVPNQ